jgi:serine/threonine protein kinase
VKMDNTVRNLIDYVEALDNIDGRYENLKCINVAQNQAKRGALSLVFTAKDALDDKDVIIKMIDPNFMANRYRQTAFEREPEVLERLVDKPRCLTLLFGPSSFPWDVELEPGNTLSFDMNYFVTDFIDHDIDKFFIDQLNCTPLEKLEVFRSTVLAINSVHSEGVCHRDIKCDNFRARSGNQANLDVIAIDFGTAVHQSDAPLIHATFYPNTVGAVEYSSPEAQSGLQSYREIGHLNDIYALGAMLYQMFNSNLFYWILKQTNGNYAMVCSHMASMLAAKNSNAAKLSAWRTEMPRFRLSVEPPSISARGNSIPKSIEDILVSLHRKMTMFDFDQRVQSLEPVIHDLDRAIRVLGNVKLEQKKKYLRNKRKARREQKLLHGEKKLNDYLLVSRNAEIN